MSRDVDHFIRFTRLLETERQARIKRESVLPAPASPDREPAPTTTAIGPATGSAVSSS